MSLDKNITDLQDTIYSSNFDISSSFLPDNEIVKNIFLSKNSNMTRAEVDQMVDGKKIFTIQGIFKHYMEEGMAMDFAYLVVLIVDLISDAGVFRLIILLKLPECF